MLRVGLGDVGRGNDVEIFAVGRGAFRPVVAAHDRDAAIDDQRLFMGDPGAGVDPDRDAGRGGGVEALLQIAGRPAVGEDADVDAAAMARIKAAGRPEPMVST